MTSLMNTDTEMLEMRIVLKRAFSGRKVEGIWVVDERLLERKGVDGTVYVMDYGIKNVYERITFPRAVNQKSRAVQDAIKALSNKYPLAKVAIY